MPERRSEQLRWWILIPMLGLMAACGGSDPRAVTTDAPIAQAREADNELPPGWNERIDRSTLEATRIRLLDERPRSLTTSKVGGEPYWPEDRALPVGSNGERLHFLAQINFAEIDDPPGGFPRAGLLQFFIAADDLYGASLEMPRHKNTEKAYAVVFHESVDGDRGNGFKAPAISDEYLLPHRGSAQMIFEPLESRVTPMDYRFEHLVARTGDLSYDVLAPLYERDSEVPAHQIGGYATFTQEDPRGYSAGGRDWMLLFQLDTQYNDRLDLMWGDDGIANFFIRPRDLVRKDFSSVWYNWDCH